MENKGLLFIPDISGFTRFVNETDIEHSRLIIQELLELLINSNQLGLTVSEVEGDAILFYKFGEAPAAEELYKQVEKNVLRISPGAHRVRSAEILSMQGLYISGRTYVENNYPLWRIHGL